MPLFASLHGTFLWQRQTETNGHHTPSSPRSFLRWRQKETSGKQSNGQRPSWHNTSPPTHHAVHSPCEAHRGYQSNKLLTRRSASRDGLWVVTGSALKTLRNQFNSRLCILRSLRYAEFFRLVTVGRWLSRIDWETSIELDSLDNHVRAKTTQTTYNKALTSDSDDDDIHPRQDGPQTVSNIEPYGSYTLTHPQNPKPDTAPNNRTYALASRSKCQDDISISEPQAFHGCWPTAGKCHSYGFGPQQRVGIICIGHTKVCDSCGMTGHMVKVCKKGPGMDVVNPSTLADTPTSDPEKGILQHTTPTYMANPSDDQNKSMDSGEEANTSEEGTYDVIHHDNTNRNTTMIANNKPTSATNSDIIRHPKQNSLPRSEPAVILSISSVKLLFKNYIIFLYRIIFASVTLTSSFII